jgi:hypothetical protein
MGMLKRFLLLGFSLLLTFAVAAPWASSQEEETRVPAFHQAPPANSATLPPIIGKEQLWGGNDQYPYQSHAYELAPKVHNVLYQQPCYCYCDRMGTKVCAAALKALTARSAPHASRNFITRTR